jgi:1,4-alpha-glucan branching enzyme
MHDTLDYFSADPVFRKYHHNNITFSIWYAFFENFMLPLSHDEVVYGKGALAGKMPGNGLQKMANLRLLFGYQYTHPGKKLMFMGCEFGQWAEWNHESSIEWHLLQFHSHYGIWRWVRDLNHFYRSEPAMYELDFENAGFEWVDFSDQEASTISFLRKSRSGGGTVLAVFNFTPVPRMNYLVGVPEGGFWKEVLNSDALDYGGEGYGNFGGVEASHVSCHHRSQSLLITLPPLGMVLFKK